MAEVTATRVCEACRTGQPWRSVRGVDLAGVEGLVFVCLDVAACRRRAQAGGIWCTTGPKPAVSIVDESSVRGIES